MLDIGWPELMLVAAVTIIVVGPRELPRVLRTVNGYIRKARSLASEFQDSIEDMAREADLDDLKKQWKETGESFSSDFEKSIDPTGEVSSSMQEVKDSMNARYNDKSNRAPGNSVTPPAEDSAAGSTSAGTGESAGGKTASAKKTGAKKAGAKKAAGKTGAKKTAAKKASAKTTGAKTGAGKAASAKQAAGTKAAAKKTAAKTSTTKKTGAKKASAKTAAANAAKTSSAKPEAAAPAPAGGNDSGAGA